MRLIILVLILMISCSPNKDSLRLLKDVNDLLNSQKGKFAVAFKDLQSGETLLINEREMFHAASTMKTPVMVEVFRQASEGKFKMTDSILVKNEFRSIVDGSLYSLSPGDDSDQELYEKVGTKMSIEELTYRMIIVSSNLATNLIIELVDAKNVTNTMRAMGAHDIKVLRGVEDSKAFEKGLINETSAFDLMLLFEKMAKNELPSSDSMIDILHDQKFDEIIPAKLPQDVRVAHKTGNINGVRHDSGIVFLPDGRKYVLVLLSKELEDEALGIQVMADVSERIYRFFALGV